MLYKNNNVNNFIKAFSIMTIIKNFITFARFFEATYYNIFKDLFTISFQEGEFLSFVSIYFGRVETNSIKMRYLVFEYSFVISFIYSNYVIKVKQTFITFLV